MADINFEFGVSYFSGEGIQAHGAMAPIRDVFYDVTEGVFTTVQIEEHLPWSVEETGRRCRRCDKYYGVTDEAGKKKLEEAFAGITSNYEVFLKFEA